MMPSGPPTPVGGQSMSPSLLRSNSGMLVGQGAQMPPQAAFSSLMSPRPQYNNGNLLGNVPSVSSLLNQSFVNGGANSGLSVNGNNPRGGIDAGAEPDPLSGVGNAMGYNPPSSSFIPTSLASVGPSGQGQGHQFSMSSGSQLLHEQQHTQQLETPNFQHDQQQFSASLGNQQQAQKQQPQQQFQSFRGGLASVAPVKLEPQVTNDQHGHQQQPQQQLQSSRALGVKMEQQPQLQGMRQLPPVKMEPLHSDQSLPLHQQQMLQMPMSRQSPQAAAAQQFNLLQQQRMLQMQQQQQQQQQQLLKSHPQQRSQVPQQFQQQNMAIRPPIKSGYEPGMCARRLTHYMYQQQHRPDDNNIEFWRKFVSEYFAPNAKKKWCVSMYGSGRQTTGVFPQDAWHCEICNHKPGRGFEATFEVLPRLFKIKYESGTLEELLYVDMPREYHNNSGQIVLDYAKAIQESVFEHLRVVRDGQLRIVFSPDLKICSWEFCARKHEELIPRRLLIPQVSQLGSAAQRYQTATQNTSSSNMSVSDLQTNCNMFVSSARQLAKTLEVPLVNDLGYTKRYVRCLQISEVVNSMKDLIDYSRMTGTGPMDSLAKFPRRTSTPHGIPCHNQQPDEQQKQQQRQPQEHQPSLQQQQRQPQQHQPSLQQQQQSPQQQAMAQNSNNDPSSVQAESMQVAPSNGVPSACNNVLPASTSASTIAGLVHQNSMNARQQNSLSNANSPYCGNPLSSPGGSSSSMQQPQTNPSLFHSPTPSSSNNPPQTSHNAAVVANNHLSVSNSRPHISMQQQQQQAFSGEGEANDSQNSVQRILQEMMSSQVNGGAGGMTGVGSLGNEMKNINDILPQGTNTRSLNGVNSLLGNGPCGSNSGMVGAGAGFGSGSGGIGQPAMVNGIRTAMGNNPMGALNGRVGLMTRDQSMSHQQQDTANQLLGGLGFNNLQFDWKPSP